jgi:hypothetical protein
MGLTIHWTSSLPASTQPAEVDDLLEKLRRRAEELAFTTLTPVHSALDDASSLQLLASIVAEVADDDGSDLCARPATARGFFGVPGVECEPAIFAFLQREDGAGVPRDWYWWCACKTQYASLVSEQHFMDCHKRLVAVLDFAASLGMTVTVHDEGEYWESRDDSRLLAHLRRSNHILAAFAGRLSDTLGPSAVDAPILGHPSFERIEMDEDG